MKKTKEILNNLFDVTFDFMFLSSGDGCSLFVSDDYVGIADLFEKWLNNNHQNYLTRIDDIIYGAIRFENGQEAVVFTDGLDSHYHNAYEFISILPNWYLEFIEHDN
jgi:hypothetical protein